MVLEVFLLLQLLRLDGSGLCNFIHCVLVTLRAQLVFTFHVPHTWCMSKEVYLQEEIQKFIRWIRSVFLPNFWLKLALSHLGRCGIHNFTILILIYESHLRAKQFSIMCNKLLNDCLTEENIFRSIRVVWKFSPTTIRLKRNAMLVVSILLRVTVQYSFRVYWGGMLRNSQKIYCGPSAI